MAKQLNVNLSFVADTSQAKAQINSLMNDLQKISNMNFNSIKNINPNELNQASIAAKELAFHLNEAYNASSGNIDLSKLNHSLNSSKTNVTQLSKALLGAGTTGQQAFIKLAQSIASADYPMVRINTQLSTMLTTLKNTARWQLSSSILHGFIGALNSAYGYAQDLNESLTNIRIVTGQNTDQMAAFAERANAAAKALSASTTEYTDAALIFYQQGLDDDAVEARTQATMKMAHATGDSATEVSSYMTAIWNNFDDGSESMEHYADVIAALGASTASSSSEIAGGLQQFAAVSETIGLSYDYATSALATLVANTRQSEQTVGNSLKTIFARLQGLQLGETLEDGVDLNKYSKALKVVGVDVLDMNGELKNADDILSDLAQKWENISDAQKTALAQTVAGVRQYTMLTSLMEHWDDMETNLETASNADGILNKQAEIYAQGWEAARDRVKASLQGIYQDLLDERVFIGWLNFLEKMASGLDNVIEEMGGLKGVIIAIGSLIMANIADKIGPALQNAFLNLKVIFTSAQQQASQLANQMRQMNAEQIKNGNFNIAQQQELQNASQLTAARTQLSLASKNMSDQEKQMAEFTLQGLSIRQQEAQQIAETITKLQAEHEALLSISEVQFNSEALDTYNNKLKQLYEDLEIAKEIINETVYNENTSSLDQAIQEYETLKNDIDLYKQTQEELQSALQQSTQLMAENYSVAEKTEAEYNQLANGALQPFINVLDDVSAEIRNNTQIFDQDGIAKTMYENRLKLIIKTMPRIVSESSKVQKALAKMTNASSLEEYEAGLAELKNALLQTGQTSETVNKIFQELDGKKYKEVKSNVEALETEEEKLKAVQEALNRAFAEFNPSHVVTGIERITSAASSLGQIAMMASSIRSIFNAWSSDDMSFGERLTTTFMSLSMIVPGVITTFKALRTVISGTAIETALYEATLKKQGLTEAEINAQKAITLALHKKEVASKISMATITTALTGALKAEKLELTAEEMAIVANTIATKLKEGADLKTAITTALATARTKGSTVAIGEETAAKIADRIATDSLRISVQALLGPIGIAIGVITAIVTALTMWAKHSEEVAKQQREIREETAKTASEQASKTQEELNNVNELYKAYLEAKTNLDGSEESKLALKTATDNLCESLGIEWDILQKLHGEYETVNKDILENQKLKLESAISDNKLAIDAKRSTVEDKVDDIVDEYDFGHSTGVNADGTSYDRIYINPDTGTSTNDDEELLHAMHEYLSENFAEIYDKEKTVDSMGSLYKDSPTQMYFKEDANEYEVIEAMRSFYEYLQSEEGPTDKDGNKLAGKDYGGALGQGEVEGWLKNIYIDSDLSELMNEIGELESQNEQNYMALADVTAQIAALDLQEQQINQKDDNNPENGDTEEKVITDPTTIDNYEDYKSYRENYITQLKASLEASGADMSRYTEDTFEQLADDYLSGYENIQQVIEDHSLEEAIKNIFSKNGEQEDNINSFFDNLTEDDRTILKIHPEIITDNTTTESLRSTLDALQGEVDNQELQVKVTAVETAKASVKENMTEEDYNKVQKSGIDWGNEKEGIIEFSQFVSMSYEEQTNYLKQLSQEYNEQILQNTAITQDKLSELLANVQNRLETLPSEVEAAKTILDGLENDGEAPSEEIEEARVKYEALVNETNALINQETLLKQQLDENYILWVEQSNAVLQNITSLEELNAKLSALGNNIDYSAYANALISLGSAYKECSNEIDIYQRALVSGTEEMVKNAEESLKDSIATAELAKSMELSVDDIEDQSRAFQESYEGLKDNASAAKRMATLNQSMNKGVTKLAKNWDDWADTLKSSEKTSMDYIDTMQECKSALKDLLGVTDEDFIPDDFMEMPGIMDLMAQAAKGDVNAINKLGNELAKATIDAMEFEGELNEVFYTIDGEKHSINIDTESFNNAKQTVLAGIQELQNQIDTGAINVGDSVDCMGSDWVAALNEMALATNMSVAQMNAVLNELGVEAEVNTVQQEVQTNVPEYTTEETVTENPDPSGGTNPTARSFTKVSHSYQSGSVPVTETIDVAQINTGDDIGTAPKVTYTGRSTPSKSAKSGGSGGGRGGRGGGRRGDRPKERQNKDAKKHREIEGDLKIYDEEIERYHEIEKSIDNIQEKLDKYENIAGRAFGKAKVKALKDSAKAYKDLAKAYNTELQENQDWLNKDIAKARDYGWKLDADGNVSNYEENMKRLVNAQNAAEEKYLREYNKAVAWFNSLSGDAQAEEGNKKKFENLTKKAEEDLEDANKLYEDSVEALKQVEESQEKREELIKQQREALQKALDAEVEAVDVTVQVRLDIADADLKLLKEILEQIGDSADGAADAIGVIGQEVGDLEAKAKTARQGIAETLAVYTDRDLLGNNALDQSLVDKIMAGGELTVDDKEALLAAGITEDTISKLESYEDELIDVNGALRDLRDEALQKTSDAFDEFVENLDRSSEKIQHLQKVTETYKNIIGIVGKKVIDASGELTKQLGKANFEMQRNNTHALKSELEFIDQSIQNQKDAIARLMNDNANGQHDEAIKQMNQQLKEMEDQRDSTYESWLDSWQAEMQDAADIYAETLESVVENFSDSLAGALGSLDELEEEFSRKKEIQDLYLDDYRQIYELSKLTRDINKSIDDTDNIKSKQALKSLMKDIEQMQENGVKLSEYDLENLQRQYELELAKQQLKESQEAKSEVRMTRDSEGNYGYVYTADSNAVAEAEQNYEDKLYAMQKANADYIEDLQNNIISAEQACADALAELDASQFASYEEYQEAVARVQADYSELIEGYYQQIGNALDNNRNLYQTEWTEYNSMTGYKISADEDYVDSFNETRLSILTGYSDIETAQEAWNQAVNAATNEAALAYEEWYERTQIALADGKSSMQDFGSTVDEVTEDVLDRAEEAEDSADAMADSYEGAYTDILNALSDFCTDYDSKIQEIISSNTELVKSINKVTKAAANLDDYNNKNGSGSGNGGSGSGSGSDGGNNNSGGGNDNGGSNSGDGKKKGKASWDKGYAAYKRINAGAWGNGISNRISAGAKEGFSKAEVELGQKIINYTYPRSLHGLGYSMDKAKSLLGYDTGGYTGNWNSSDGKLALLHKKELVLNKDDTENMLKAVEVIREINKTIDLNALSASSGFASLLSSSSMINDSSQEIQQTVSIEASFPGVTERGEIEEAFNNLINRAAQFVNRKN